MNNPDLSYTALGIWCFLFGQSRAEGTEPACSGALADAHPGSSLGEIEAALKELQAAGILRLGPDL